MTTVLLSLLIGALAPQVPVARGEEVEFESGGVTLAATIELPDAATMSKGPVAGVVLVHGSGTSDRSNPWTAAYAKDLVAHGIAVLHPDKRGSGKSEGDWRTASLEQLAADASAGIQCLAERPEVDARRIGVIGFSQGGYVCSVVAADDAHCAFVITISGSTVPLLDQVVDEIALESERAKSPLSAPELARVRELHLAALAFARTGEHFEELRTAVVAARAENPRLRDALRGMPSRPDDPVFGFMRAVGDFDPLPYWKRVAKPALLVFGGQDSQVRGRASERRLLEAIGDEPRAITVLHFQQNGHALHRDDLLDLLASWIRHRGES